MKRVPIFLLCILLILSLVGCSEPPTAEEKTSTIKELSNSFEIDELQTLYLSLDRHMDVEEVESMIAETGLIVDNGANSLECGYDPSVVGALLGRKGDILKVEYSGLNIESISYYNYPRNITLEEAFSLMAKSVDFEEKKFENKKDQMEFLLSYENDSFDERNAITTAALEKWRNPELAEKEKMEKEKEALELAKSTALVLDKQIFDIVVNSEKNTQILQEGANLVSQGSGNLSDLYDLSSTAKSNQSQYFIDLSKLSDDNNKEYISACQDYVINSKLIAENLMKYLDKQELKYISEVKDLLELSSSYSLKLIEERTKYLSSQGLSDEEISETLSLEGETE